MAHSYIQISQANSQITLGIHTVGTLGVLHHVRRL